MTQAVAVPLWLFVLLCALALLAVLQWLLLPGLRWYFRRKVRGVMDEISVRLNIEIPPFKLTRRQALIDRLMTDPRVLLAVQQQAAQQRLSQDAVLQQAYRYAREIVPAFNAYLYFRLGYWLARKFARLLYRVRLGTLEAEALGRIDPRSTVVFVMNHRSNMDYVLVAFLAAERVALSYAVGEWARVWPLQSLIRAMGAYFVRRNSGDPLYRMVLQRYVQMATEGGVPQAVFLEGGLTTDGLLRAPKLGLLDYMLKNFDPAGERDLVFVPVGINYDRVFEDRTLLARHDPGAVRAGVLRAMRVIAAYLGRQLLRRLQGRSYRNGYACVNFGQPLSMAERARATGVDLRTLDDTARHAAVARLGEDLMERIGGIVPALPVPLVATVLLRNAGTPTSELDLKAALNTLIHAIEATGAHVYVPRADLDYALDVGLRMLTLRRMVTQEDGLLRVNPAELTALRYYANSIEHLCRRVDVPVLAARPR